MKPISTLPRIRENAIRYRRHQRTVVIVNVVLTLAILGLMAWIFLMLK